MLKNNKKGFTLIEIIVVVVILAVLMAVAVPSVLKYIDTAQEAPALTEAHAIVTAAQKKVIEKYSQTRNENVDLDDNDNQWIEEFVDEGGKIQGSISVSNKSVTKLLYLASNGLYVLYENQEYKIVDENELNNTILGQLNQMIINYTQLTNDLYASTEINLGTGREYLIKKIAKENGLIKVDDNLSEKSDSKTDLYWKPYYLNNAQNPSMILFANYSKTDHGQWYANLVYVDGKIYKCNNENIAKYKDSKLYGSTEKLLQYIENNPSVYEKIEID